MLAALGFRELVASLTCELMRAWRVGTAVTRDNEHRRAPICLCSFKGLFYLPNEIVSFVKLCSICGYAVCQFTIMVADKHMQLLHTCVYTFPLGRPHYSRPTNLISPYFPLFPLFPPYFPIICVLAAAICCPLSVICLIPVRI